MKRISLLISALMALLVLESCLKDDCWSETVPLVSIGQYVCENGDCLTEIVPQDEIKLSSLADLDDLRITGDYRFKIDFSVELIYKVSENDSAIGAVDFRSYASDTDDDKRTVVTFINGPSGLRGQTEGQYGVSIPFGELNDDFGIQVQFKVTYDSHYYDENKTSGAGCKDFNELTKKTVYTRPLRITWGKTTGNNDPDPDTTVVTGATGSLDLEPASPEVGDNLTLRVTDADLNTDNAVAETLDITASSDLGESESITLTETGVNTGIFEGTVATVSGTTAGTDNDGSFNAQNNTVVTAIYDDALDAAGQDPAAISKSVTLTETPPSSSFADFIGESVILDSTVTYNGTVIDPAQIASVNYALSSYLPDASSGCGGSTTPGQCYGFEYEVINGTTNKFDVYYNTDFNYCNCATDATPAFSNEYTVNGNTIAINSGTGFENWTFTSVGANNFTLHIISGGGSQVSERHYSVKQ